MRTFLRFFEVLTLGVWVGGIIFLSFVVAPGAFRLLPTRDQAGTIVGMALTRLHLIGYVAGLLYLAARVVGAALAAPSESFSRSALLLRPAVIAVLLMLLLTGVSQQGVTPRIAGLRAEMTAAHGSVDATPQDSPPRVEFNRLHRISVHLESGVLLLGVAALFLTVRDMAR